MRELIKKLYVDNKEQFLKNYCRLNDFHNEFCIGNDTTGKPDCWFLYLLVSHFKPRCIFEAGTNIGTSAKYMADAAKEYGGVVHTCDPVNKFLPHPDYENSIVFHNKNCYQLVSEFKEKGDKIDFAFYDANNMLPEHFFDLLEIVRDSENFVFAVHDWWDKDGKPEKGRQNMDIMWNILKDEGYELFIPELNCYYKGHVWTPIPETGTAIQYGINGCTAVALPPSFKI